jgi:hypothetical protein
MASITTQADIDLFRMTVLRQAVKLECLGMKRRGRSAVSIVKDEFGLHKRSLSKIEVLAFLDFTINQIKEANQNKA